MPHKKDHKIRVEDIFQQTPIPEQRRSLSDEEFNEYLNNLYRRGWQKGLLDETPEKPEGEEGGSFLDWLIPKAGASGLVPQEPPSLFNTGLSEWEHETMRWGAPDPVSKLGFNPNIAHVVDMGIDLPPASPEIGFLRQGQFSRNAPTGRTTIEAIVKGLGYDSPKHFWEYQKRKGNIRKDLTYEDWISKAEVIEGGEAVIANAQAMHPLNPTFWAHEFGHAGQKRIGTKSSDRELLQEMRDAMYADPNRPRELEDIAQFLEDLSEEEIRIVYGAVLEENRLANEMLAAQGRTPGAEPNMQPYNDWIAGGRTKEGYDRIRRERREKSNMPSIWGQLRKRMSGLIDTWDMGLFD